MARLLIVAAFAMLAIRCNSILGIERLHGRPDGGSGDGPVNGGGGMATGSGGEGGGPAGAAGGTAGGGREGSAGGGSGGTPVTGAGGQIGSGGNRTGSGGASGAGGAISADAGVVDCVELADSYRNMIFTATACGNGLTCDQVRPKALCSGACTTFISITTNVDRIAAQWTAGNCAATAPPCTSTDLCAKPPTSSTCHAVGFTNAGNCSDDPPGP